MKNRWTTQDIADQSGKFIIITGANSGLGYASAKALAAKGAHVILAVRNLKKGQEAVDKILTSVPKAQLALMQCDVSDLDSVTQFVEAYTSQYDWVDVLMNNAGIMATPPRKTNQGFEAQFATNHLGHFALTGRLMEALKLAPNGSRVINVSSLAARTGKMQFDDIHWNKNYRAMAVYSQSKLANQLFTYGLQRRLDQAKVHNVTSVAAHPGGTNTNIADKWQVPGVLKKTLVPLLMPLGQSPDQGALPQLFASVDPMAKPGGYYGPNRFNEVMGYPKEAKIPMQARSQADQDRLWTLSEELTGFQYLS